MKKTFFFIATALCLSQSMMAIKPLLTEGYDKYNNSFKLDLVSVGYMCPQIVWEHYTDTRFSYGVSMQTHFINHSTFVRDLNDGDPIPTTVKLDGKTYTLDWSGHPANWYADVNMEDGKHEVKWDRKYVGVMVCPEGRLYMGRKPARGFYVVLRADMGLFREQFIVSRSRLSYAQEDAIIQARKDEATANGEDPNKVSKTIEDRWQKAGLEQGETFLAAGVGGGLGFQGWFKKNAHWGFDLNTFVKNDWKFSKDDNQWEWFWGAGLPLDFNASIIYRF
ncbi:MAG: hypothetical protein IKN61_04485 [Bacteroidaceae bacterium]|jgi:hypothetical protein|nr:hypothetical protein [Bacteroidaceae bacterium]